MKRLDGVKLSVGESESKLLQIAQKQLKKPLKFFKILKKSLDARDKGNIFWVYSIAFSADENDRLPQPAPIPADPALKDLKVAVVGSGPAGLFCALRLLERGAKPIIIERGERVEERTKTVRSFFATRALNENSNVQFGEGGAGTFSDGKLNTQTHTLYNSAVLEYFHRFGAPEEILYLNKPHIGSDNLAAVLKNIRAHIESEGGRYLFGTLFTGFTQQGGRLTSLILKDLSTGVESELRTDCAVLALGHSARETFVKLHAGGIYMTPREFAAGFRIEHSAQSIGFAQYGTSFQKLPAADYKLVSHAHERTVFTFCMCPGGVVIPAASERGGLAVNGMSEYARSGKNSNSALMVQLKFSDFGTGLFDGMNYQRELEKRAFMLGGGDYRAPVQLSGDFVKDRLSQRFAGVEPTYAAGTSFAPLGCLLPAEATAALKLAIADMDKRLKGFADPEAVLTGIESRFTSPVRIERGEDMQSVSLKGLYPCGEGSGYSGGITSSAADGIRAADALSRAFGGK